MIFILAADCIDHIGHTVLADRVPDTKVVDLDAPTRMDLRQRRLLIRINPPPLMAIGLAEGDGLGGFGRVPALIQRHGIADIGRRIAPHDTAIADHPDEGTRSIGPAGEAEDIDLVAGLIVEDQEHVGVDDVLDQTIAEPAAINRLAIERADTLIIEDDLLDLFATLVSAEGDGLGHFHDIGDRPDSKIELIPSAVTTDDDALHDALPSIDNSILGHTCP